MLLGCSIFSNYFSKSDFGTGIRRAEILSNIHCTSWKAFCNINIQAGAFVRLKGLPWQFLDSQPWTRHKECSSTVCLQISRKDWHSHRWRYIHFTHSYLFLLFCQLYTSLECSVWTGFYSDHGNGLESFVYVRKQYTKYITKMSKKCIWKETLWVLLLPSALIPGLLEEIAWRWERCGEYVNTGSFGILWILCYWIGRFSYFLPFFFFLSICLGFFWGLLCYFLV